VPWQADKIMAYNSEKNKLRSKVIDELISADNWFTLVTAEDKVKVFSCTDPNKLKRGLVNMMLQEQCYANLLVDAVGDYVNIMRKRELRKGISLN